MPKYDEILSNPENQRFFEWTTNGLRLSGNPPAEVVEAWRALAATQRRRPRYTLARRVQLLFLSRCGRLAALD